MIGVGREPDPRDPFIGFSRVVPLFERDGDRMRTKMARQLYFRPESFAANKPATERRLFVLGGSTVQGRPYAVETAFSTWLELTLGAADPGHTWEVVNCGGVSYASYRLVPILAEVLEYAPDLVIVYTGHNEFLEERTYDHVKQAPWFSRAHPTLSRLHAFNAARGLWLRLTSTEPPRSPTLPVEVAAMLDRPGGLDRYHRDDAWYEGVTEHFEHNLLAMQALAADQDVPLVFVDPVSDLLDTPPFKSEPTPNLPASDAERAAALLTRANDPSLGAPDRRAAASEATRIDPRRALARYLYGHASFDAGDYDVARRELVAAKDEDICPLRMREPLHRALARVCRDTGTPLVDVRGLFESLSPHGLPGRRWLADHVHPTIAGHKRIAALLFEHLASTGFVSLEPGWERRRDRAFSEHEASLPRNYAEQARIRLEGLQLWAHGHAEPSPPTSR